MYKEFSSHVESIRKISKADPVPREFEDLHTAMEETAIAKSFITELTSFIQKNVIPYAEKVVDESVAKCIDCMKQLDLQTKVPPHPLPIAPLPTIC